MHATNPEINIGIQHYHKPTNPKINIHHKPTNSYQQNSTHKPTIGIHISTTICTTELRDREMKEPFRSEFERKWDHEIREFRIISASQPLIWAPIPNQWLGFYTTEPYQISDYGELPNQWTFAMGFLSTESWTSSTAATSSLRFERVWVWERFRQGWREKEKIRDRESLEMRLKEKEKELRLKKIWFEMRFGSLFLCLCLFFN